MIFVHTEYIDYPVVFCLVFFFGATYNKAIKKKGFLACLRGVCLF